MMTAPSGTAYTPPQNNDDRYIQQLGMASEDVYQIVDDLASKALMARRISEAERVNAGNPRWQIHFSMVARAGVVDCMNLLKAIAERLDELKQDEEKER